jgi:hypothetical protein
MDISKPEVPPDGRFGVAHVTVFIDAGSAVQVKT